MKIFPSEKRGLLLFLAFIFMGSLLFLKGSLLYAGKEDTPPTSWFIDLSRFAASAHGTLTCEACHGTMKEQDKLHPDMRDPQFLKLEASRKYDYKRCQTCHRPSYEYYLKGAHARALQKEREPQPTPTNLKKLPAPTCGNCHASHYEKAHRSRLEIGRDLTEVCGSCHQAQKVTYLDNFHGKAAVNLGNTRAAYCTDCHGAHECLSLKDRPKALESCQRCHPQANLSFASMVIHPALEPGKEKDAEKEARVAVIKLITVVMGTLVLVVVIFFYGHSFLWLLREIHEKLKRRK
jgi:Cytochrome c554 and c-prime